MCTEIPWSAICTTFCYLRNLISLVVLLWSRVEFHTMQGQIFIFSVILKRNDHSDTLDFKNWVSGGGRVVTFFVLKIPDYKFVMLIYSYVRGVYTYM